MTAHATRTGSATRLRPDGRPVTAAKGLVIAAHHAVADARLCHAEVGDEQVAHPAPEARILVIERKGSV